MQGAEVGGSDGEQVCKSVSVARIRREGLEIRSRLGLPSNGGPTSTPVRGAVGRSCREWLLWEGRIDSHITSLC